MKGKVFNPVLDFINTLCNFIALNLVFLLTCLPIITIGSALSALYYVTLKEARGEYGYLVRTYLKEFKNNLRAGIPAFLILFAIGAILLYNAAFWNALDSLLGSALFAVVLVATIGYYLVFTYTFPLIARFENKTTQTLKNALLVPLSNIKSTLFLLLIDALVFFFCLFLAPAKILMVLFGFALIAYAKSFVLKEVFKNYEPSPCGESQTMEELQ